MKPAYIIGNRKVAIIGSGYVGSSIAYALALRDIAREVVIINRTKEKAQGEVLDIRHGISSMGTTDVYVGDYADCADSDIIIICAGRNRKPGESRLDLTSENVEIMRSVIEQIRPYYSRGCILVISNPVDILTYKAAEWLKLPDGMIFGTGCVLDSSRFVRTVADYLNLSTGVINGYLVGEHGEHQVPIWSRLTVGGIAIEEYCQDCKIEWNERVRENIAKATRNMGAEIIRAKGRTHYGIATAVCYLADAIINQRPTIASVTSPLMGEHGVREVALSVPSVVGPAGVQQRIREKWAPEEYRGFFDAVERVKAVLKQLG